MFHLGIWLYTPQVVLQHSISPRNWVFFAANRYEHVAENKYKIKTFSGWKPSKNKKIKLHQNSTGSYIKKCICQDRNILFRFKLFFFFDSYSINKFQLSCSILVRDFNAEHSKWCSTDKIIKLGLHKTILHQLQVMIKWLIH